MYVDTHVAEGSQVNNGSVISFNSAVAELSKKAVTSREAHHHSVTEMPIAVLQEWSSSLSLTEYSLHFFPDYFLSIFGQGGLMIKKESNITSASGTCLCNLRSFYAT